MTPSSYQRVLVTGATSGIGEAVAIAFGQMGASVGILGRDRERASQVAAAVNQAGGQATILLADLSDPAQTQGKIEEFVSTVYGLDVAVNAAALDISRPFGDYTLAEFDQIFAVNVRGLWVCLQAELRAMRLQKSGVIINTTSIAARIEVPQNSLYNASKAAVSMLTRCAALEEGPNGIRVLELAPGPVDTPMLQHYVQSTAAPGTPPTYAALNQASPLGRVGTPAEIAQAVLFLASPQAAYITGACLTVDGGFSLGL